MLVVYSAESAQIFIFHVVPLFSNYSEVMIVLGVKVYDIYAPL